MNENKLDPEQAESIVRRIIAYYIDWAESRKADDLILYLGGGMIPADAVTVLRPILESLVNVNSKFGAGLIEADYDALEFLREDVETLYTNRAATRSALKEAINSPQWLEAERAHTAQCGLKHLPADDRRLDLLAHEVALSDFTAEEIHSTFQNDSASVAGFIRRWCADCHGRDYGEEWDPDEGNQQEDNPPGEALGMRQGFLASHIVLYLYAAKAPGKLADYYKRRKMPHGKKVAKDVLRVYRQTTKGNL